MRRFDRFLIIDVLLPFAAVSVAAVLFPEGTLRGLLSAAAAAIALSGFSLLFLLALAALRRRVEKSRGGDPGEAGESWRRLRGIGWFNHLRIVTAVVLLYSLLLLVIAVTRVHPPGEHEVTVTAPTDIRSMSFEVQDPDPAECGDQAQVGIARWGNGKGEVKVEVSGQPLDPTSSDSFRSWYEIPMTWERSISSCYYEFPHFRTSGGPIPVNLILPARGSAASSIPPPTRFAYDSWGWQCTARTRGSECDVLAVVDIDPDAVLAALVLLIGGLGLGISYTLGKKALSEIGKQAAEDAAPILRFLRAKAHIPLSRLQRWRR